MTILTSTPGKFEHAQSRLSEIGRQLGQIGGPGKFTTRSTAVDLRKSWEWNVSGGIGRSVHSLRKSRRSAKTRIRHPISIRQRAVKKLGANLQKIVGARRTPAHLLLFAQSMVD